MPAARSKGSRSLSSRWESRETPRPMPAQQEGAAEGRGARVGAGEAARGADEMRDPYFGSRRFRELRLLAGGGKDNTEI